MSVVQDSGPSRLRPPGWLPLLTAAAAFALPSCGARTALKLPPPLPPEPECHVDGDCPGYDDLCAPVRCVDPHDHEDLLPELPADTELPPLVCLVIAPVDCDDHDVCTDDACVAETGECAYEPVTLDSDGDGYRAPRPGYEPGAPDSCGDDCDDTSRYAHPGAQEVCDGVDNDCNGIVDDDADYIPLMDEPVRISGDIAPAEPGGLAFNGETYLALYTGTSAGFDLYETRLDPLGNKLPPIEQRIGLQNADSYGAPIKWTGDRYGVAWEDRRDGDYEIYFTLLDAYGAKIIPDTRLTKAWGFSINVDMTWNGTEFIVVWQDQRSGEFEIMAQLVSVDGEPIGYDELLTPTGGFGDESPAVASGIKGFGVAYTNGHSGMQSIRFRSFEHGTLEPLVDPLTVTDGTTQAVYPAVAFNQDRYIVAWFDRTAQPKAIYATTLTEDGVTIVPPTAVSQPGAFRSRYPKVLPLGDRALIVYADDRDDNNGYELYSRMVAVDLSPIGPERRLTFAPYDSVQPVAAFGPGGDLGILFRDDRQGGEHHVWFTRLGCVTTP